MEINIHNCSGCHLVDCFALRVNCAVGEVYARHSESPEGYSLTEPGRKDKTVLNGHLLDERQQKKQQIGAKEMKSSVLKTLSFTLCTGHLNG